MLALLRRWWQTEHDLPGPRALGIELVVVVIGVFGAQQLSNWNQNRLELQQMESVYRNLSHSFSGYRQIAKSYQAAIPCISERVDLLSRLASLQEQIDPRLLEPATLIRMGPDSVSQESYQLIRDRYGDTVADRMGNVEFNLQTIELSGGELEQRWFELQRLNSETGKVGPADRDAARATATQIKGNLFTLGKSANLIIKLTDLLGIKSASNARLQPVQNCAQMWRTKRGYVDLDEPGENIVRVGN